MKDITDLEDRLVQAEASRDAFTQVFTSLNEGSIKVNGDVATANSVLPDNVYLSMISHDGETMQISGSAHNENEILIYASSLRDSARFLEVVVSNMARNEDDFIDFSLLLKSGQ